MTLHLEGYRTVTRNIWVTPDDAFKLQLSMDKLGPGEVSDPPPLAARPSARAAEQFPTSPLRRGRSLSRV